MNNSAFKNAMEYQFAVIDLESMLEEFEDNKACLLLLSSYLRKKGYRMAVGVTEQTFTIRHMVNGYQCCESFIRGHKQDLTAMRVLILLFQDAIRGSKGDKK